MHSVAVLRTLERFTTFLGSEVVVSDQSSWKQLINIDALFHHTMGGVWHYPPACADDSVVRTVTYYSNKHLEVVIDGKIFTGTYPTDFFQGEQKLQKRWTLQSVKINFKPGTFDLWDFPTYEQQNEKSDKQTSIELRFSVTDVGTRRDVFFDMRWAKS